MASHRATTVRAALVGAAVVAAAVTACGTTRPTASAPPAATAAGPATPARTSPVASGAPTTTGPGTTAPDAGGAAPTGSPATTAGTAAPAACATSQLTAALGPPDGSAGHVGLLLDLTNVARRACTLYGFPGVSYVTGDAGIQVGAAAARSATGPAGVVTLAPGQPAQSTVLEIDPAVYPASTCRPVQVRGLRGLYPPGQRDALFVAQPAEGCGNPSIQQLTVGPVRPDGTASA